MFLGTYLVNVTSGKRVVIPSVFRENLDNSLVLANWYEECLVLVSKSSLNTLLTRVTGKEEMIINPVRQTEHFIFASAFDVAPDDQGRIVIPDRLVSYAKLGEQVYFLGIGDRIEIWNKEIWDEKEKLIVKEAPEYIEELSKRNEK
jgi:MraZ protein